MQVKIIRVEHFTSKAGKPCHVSWFSDANYKEVLAPLPSKCFCPEWVQADMILDIRIVPDFRCNASIEFVKPDSIH